MIWVKLFAMLASLLSSPPTVEIQSDQEAKQDVWFCATPAALHGPASFAWTAAPAANRPTLVRCATASACSGQAIAVAANGAVAAAALRAAADDDDDDQDGADADDDDDGDAPSPPRRRPLRFAEQAGPWIGVTLAPVPPVLSSHLNLDGDRLMILNVAEESPADKAGIRQYDVIVELNGKPVGGKADEFAGRIRKMAVGDEAKLVILRGGSRKTVTITTSARPKLDTIKYKYKVDAGDEVVDTQESRGMMLRRGPNGQWQMMPFAPPAQPVPPIAPVPPVPPTPGLAPIPPLDLFRGGWPDVGSTFVIVETQDGATTEIRREANGEIKVSRSKEGDSSKAKVQTYKSVDDLKKGDPEAYAMYRRLRDRSPQVRAWNWSDMGGRIDESVRREMEQAQREIERALAAAQDARRQAQSYARDRHGRPDVRFDVDADGRIKVITRDGDQELVRTFKNADELREKKPKLYERYRRLHEEESEDD